MHVYRNIVTILLSNVRSLLKNTTDIVNDHRFMHNDILLFAEVQINLEQDVDDDDEWFLCYGWLKKDFEPYFQPEPLSEIVTISNLRHTASRFWTCKEPDLGFVELSCAVVMTTPPWCQYSFQCFLITIKINFLNKSLPYRLQDNVTLKNSKNYLKFSVVNVKKTTFNSVPLTVLKLFRVNRQFSTDFLWMLIILSRFKAVEC